MLRFPPASISAMFVAFPGSTPRLVHVSEAGSAGVGSVCWVGAMLNSVSAQLGSDLACCS